MAYAYDVNGNVLPTLYDVDGETLTHIYDINGTDLIDEPFIKRILPYETNYLITQELIANAEIQRDALKAKFQQSADAIPFFIQTDGHGHVNDGNKLCYNLAESTMGYIRNFQLGDYGSYYLDGYDAGVHKTTSKDIDKYIVAMGNHEFLANDSESAPIPDLEVLVDSFVSPDAIMGSTTYGYYKVLDQKYKIKYLVFQPHIPCEKSVDSNGFLFKMPSDEWEWAISEMSANDGYDIVIINHEPFPETYTSRSSGNSFNWNPVGWYINLTPVLKARKARESGSVTDGFGVTHSYDFTGTTSDLLCAFYGHMHAEGYTLKSVFGFPTYYANQFDNSKNLAYGLIDREHGKLYIYSFNKDGVNAEFSLDL